MKPTTAIKNRVWVCACAIFVFATTSPAAQAQKTFEVLYTFTGNGPDGLNPASEVLFKFDGMDNGRINSTTASGGQWGQGTVFGLHQIPGGWEEYVRYSFGSNPSGDGIGPSGNLIRDAAGNIYGTTNAGGDPSCNCGTVWKLDKNDNETILHNFTGAPDGANPNGLISDKAGNLYGTTTAGGDKACKGGSTGCGIVFKIDTNGEETVLHPFHGNGDGALPYGALVEKKGWLYGTTSEGGDFDEGTIFKMHAGNGAEFVLYRFDGNKHPGDGCNPLGGLLPWGNAFYGTTSQCGSSGWGTVFKLEGNTETVVYNFTGKTDGGYPQETLIRQGSSNFLWGTTFYGGFVSDCPPYGCGTVFKVDVSNGKETVLHAFTDGNDGALPAGALTDGGRSIFGTTTVGGAGGAGVVFDIH
jgi:uncharacterized repeat protein (TIGR03803 family)